VGWGGGWGGGGWGGVDRFRDVLKTKRPLGKKGGTKKKKNHVDRGSEEKSEKERRANPEGKDLPDTKLKNSVPIGRAKLSSGEKGGDVMWANKDRARSVVDLASREVTAEGSCGGKGTLPGTIGRGNSRGKGGGGVQKVGRCLKGKTHRSLDLPP